MKAPVLFIPAMALLLAASPVAAQRVESEPNPTMSLQTQLGAIPLVSPRAARQASRVRTVRITHIGEGGKALGAVQEVACPETGCQHSMALDVGGTPIPFMADIQFVSSGAYVSLQARAVAVGAVVDFERGRRGPVFLKGGSNASIGQTLRYALAPSATLRRLDVADDGKTMAAGNVYTRKRSPDVVLRVEIGPARERQQ